MIDIKNKIEGILFFRNEPTRIKELASILGVSHEEIVTAVQELSEARNESGIVVVQNGDEVILATNRDLSGLIEKMVKDELSRELSKASAETLAIIAYKGPLSRAEVDHIRGVNSTYSIRALLERGLIERVDGSEVRGAKYRLTLDTLAHLGIKSMNELPEFNSITEQLNTIEHGAE